ncbi:MAG TPA: head GIN domain-containing protein [Hanamia sp.]
MKNFILLLIASFGLISCNVISGNGDVRDEKRNIPNIRTVKTSGSIDVEIKSGDSYSLSVEDDENLLPYLVTEVKDGVLNIHYKNGYNINNAHAKVYVSAPSLDKIITSGSGDISGNGIIKNANQIEFNLSGSGDVDAQVDAPSIKVTGSGSGNIKLAGRTKDFNCKVSGSGDVNCGNLQSENTEITISGNGNAHVFASVSLVARTSGSGDIYYLGNPQSPEIHTSGSGTVQPQK